MEQKTGNIREMRGKSEETFSWLIVKYSKKKTLCQDQTSVGYWQVPGFGVTILCLFTLL